MRDKSTRKYNPIVALTAVLVLSWAALIWSGLHSYNSYNEKKKSTQRQLKLETLRSTIIHLDEVLTMSARMAAVSGDTSWEDRYRRYEPKLDAAIKQAILAAP